MPTRPAARKEMRRGTNVALSPVKVAAKAQDGQSGEGGRATTPGEADQPGPGEGGAPGDTSQPGANASGMQSEGDSASAQQGAGAGTGEAGDPTGEEGAASAADLEVGAGEDPADVRRFDRRRRGSRSRRPRRRQPWCRAPIQLGSARRADLIRRRVGDARLRRWGDGGFRVSPCKVKSAMRDRTPTGFPPSTGTRSSAIFPTEAANERLGHAAGRLAQRHAPVDALARLAAVLEARDGQHRRCSSQPPVISCSTSARWPACGASPWSPAAPAPRGWPESTDRAVAARRRSLPISSGTRRETTSAASTGIPMPGWTVSSCG